MRHTNLSWFGNCLHPHLKQGNQSINHQSGLHIYTTAISSRKLTSTNELQSTLKEIARRSRIAKSFGGKKEGVCWNSLPTISH